MNINGVASQSVFFATPGESAKAIAVQREALVPSKLPAQAETKTAEEVVDEFRRRFSPELVFSVEREDGLQVVRISNPTTKEVIHQFPSEEWVTIARGLEKFKTGLIVNRSE